MKRLYYIITLGFSLALALVSCEDFLNREPVSDLTVETFWKTEKDAYTGITSIYYAFSRAMTQGVWNWGEGRSDNFNFYEKNAPDQQELVTNGILIDNVAARWTTLYSCIGRANSAIKYIPNIPMSAALKNHYLAEAHALRAWCYFYCIRIWGDVPLYVEPVESINDGIYRERVSKDHILTQVILPDLEIAYAGIDKKSGESASKRNHINVAAICALTMDVYAWMHNYQMVTQVFEERVSKLSETRWRYLVAENGTSFATEWRKMFFESTATETSPEVWFKIDYDRYGSGVNNAIQFLARSDCKFTVSAKLRTGGVYGSSDKRPAASWSGSRLTKKFWEDGTKFSGTGAIDSDVDLVMYRYADAILLYAEALCNQGRTDEAIVQLNKTHTRAGNTAYTQASLAQSLSDAIAAERQKEFVGEGKRWFDLVRTGKWQTELNPDYGMTEEKLLFPIHRDHLLQNPNLAQNPGYPRP